MMVNLTKSKKMVASVLATVMIFGGSASVFASSASPVSSVERVTQADPSQITQNSSREPEFKRYLAKKAIQGIASALRAGANNAWVQKAIKEYFDQETANVFKRHLHDIADVLDRAVELNELASAWIKSEIKKVIKAATNSDELAESIADGVVALIDIFL